MSGVRPSVAGVTHPGRANRRSAIEPGRAGGRRGSAEPGFSCSECGHLAAKWHGRCPQCQAWGTLTQSAPAPTGALRRRSPGPVSAPAIRIDQVTPDLFGPRPSGLGELDRVLGGGFVPGVVILLAGEPGVGKSTLLLSAARSCAESGQGPVLIVSGEESAGQVRLRADRIGAVHPEIYLAAESSLSGVLAHIDAVHPRLLVVDSVQTIAADDIDGTAGGVSQVRAVAAALTAVAKERNIACVLVGHVTKDGSIAGPRVLEHLVDVVLHFEGDRHSTLRVVRGVKNRYGPADEVGCFQMVHDGIVGLADPSGLFLSGRAAAVPGTCATITLQGRRPVPVEVQALITPASGEQSRRTVSGLDSTRAAMVTAIAQRWGGVALAGRDVLAATVGGIRTIEPATDLALALALWSSARDIPLPTGLVAIGELGLSGEVRPVTGLDRRLAEARRLGFTAAIVPSGASAATVAGLRIDEAADLVEALQLPRGEDWKVIRMQRRPG